MEEKRKLNPLVPILAVLLVAAIGLCVFLWIGKTKAEKLAEEYKASYDDLAEANKKAEQSAKKYQKAYNQLVSDMLSDAAKAETLGNQIVSVWHNAIWNTVDAETDKYTKVNGRFVSDFNDALKNLFSDTDFIEKDSELRNRQKQVKEDMKKMLNPPEGYENAFKALEAMYNAYISFTDIVIQCDGSLESFSNDFGEADEKLIEQYNAAELYVK